MNPGLLDQLNRNDAIRNIAICGGLVSTTQFARFVDLHPRSARRAYISLEQHKMIRIVRNSRRAAFIALKSRMVAALGVDLPKPPDPKTMRLINYQLCLARAEYFLREGRLTHATNDLSSARLKGRRTLARIERVVQHQQRELKRRGARVAAQLKASPTPKLREEALRIRRHLREPADIIAAGAAALRHLWGLFLTDPAGAQPRFVYVDRATSQRRYLELVEMLSRFSAATSLRTSLDIVCGSQLSQQRIQGQLKQLETRVAVRVLDLDYDSYVNASANLPALIGHERIVSMLGLESPAPGDC